LSCAISQFVLGYQAVNFRILVVPLIKHCCWGFFGFKFWIYSTVFTPHIYFIILTSMIAGNIVEIRLPQIQNRKCLRKSNIWRYRAENVFGNLISMKLECRGYQHITCLNPRYFFLPRCLKCSLPFKPIVSLIFC
jgi:hypothetical protein